MLGYCGVYTLDMKTSSLETLIESNRTVAGEALNLHDPQENSCTTEDAVRELRDIIRGSGTGITALEIPNFSNLEQILANGSNKFVHSSLKVEGLRQEISINRLRLEASLQNAQSAQLNTLPCVGMLTAHGRLPYQISLSSVLHSKV